MIKYSYDKNDNIDLKSFIISLDKTFNNCDEIIHKDRNCTKKIFLKENVYAVKSFKIPNFAQRFIYANLRKSKAQRSFENSHKLLKVGINTPKPVGFVFFKNNFLLEKSYYISSYHNYQFDLRYVFDNFEESLDIITFFIKQVIIMHDNNIYHHDLTRQNVLINKNKNLIDMSFIDNNRMSFRKLSLKNRMESISKLSNEISELEFLAKTYSKYTDYDEKDCISYIKKGFKRSQNIKKFKRFIKNA